MSGPSLSIEKVALPFTKVHRVGESEGCWDTEQPQKQEICPTLTEQSPCVRLLTQEETEELQILKGILRNQSEKISCVTVKMRQTLQQEEEWLHYHPAAQGMGNGLPLALHFSLITPLWGWDYYKSEVCFQGHSLHHLYLLIIVASGERESHNPWGLLKEFATLEIKGLYRCSYS